VRFFEMGKKKRSGNSKIDKIKEVINALLKRAIAQVEKYNGKTEDEMWRMFEKEYLEKSRKNNADKPELVIYKRALRKLRMSTKKTRRTGKVPKIEGLVVADMGRRDKNEYSRNIALQLANDNLRQAIKDGVIMFKEITRSDGKKVRKPIKNKRGEYIPRDTRKTYGPNFLDNEGNQIPNKNYGKAIKKGNYEAKYLIYASVDGDEPQLYMYKLKKSHADPETGLFLPYGTPISFGGFIQTDMQDRDRLIMDRALGIPILNGFKNQEIVIIPSRDDVPEEDLEDGVMYQEDFPTVYDLYEQGVFDHFEIDSLSDLRRWANENEDNYGIIFCANVDVLDKGEDATSSGNFLLKFDDESLLMADEDDLEDYDEVVGWVQGSLENVMSEFGIGGQVMIIGRARVTELKDDDDLPVEADDGTPLMGPPVANIYGIGVNQELNGLGEDLEDGDMKNIDEEISEDLEDEDFSDIEEDIEIDDGEDFEDSDSDLDDIEIEDEDDADYEDSEDLEIEEEIEVEDEPDDEDLLEDVDEID
jgi:hypothetical protein